MKRIAILSVFLFTLFAFSACTLLNSGVSQEGAQGSPQPAIPTPLPPSYTPGTPESDIIGTPEELSVDDPLAELSFKNGWARVPSNPTVFGGYGADQMNDVTAGGPGVVVVGFNIRNGDMDADVWYSEDGIRWLRAEDSAELGGGGTQMMNAVAAGPNGVVAVGMETIDNQSDAAVWFSNDGISWMRIPEIGTVFGDQDNQAMLAVAAIGDGFVAVGWEKTDVEIRGAVWYSTNGVAWQRVEHSEDIFGGLNLYASMEDVRQVGSSLIAIGTLQHPDEDDVDPAVWFSHDEGRTWTRITNSETSLGDQGIVRYQLVSAVVQRNDQFIMVGTEQNVTGTASEQFINGIIWRSVDGLEWERVFDHKPDFHQQTMLDAVSTSLGFFVVGYDLIGEEVQAAAWISTDGLNWMQVPHFESLFGGPGVQRINAVAEAGPGLVAVGISTETGEQDTAIWVYVPEK